MLSFPTNRASVCLAEASPTARTTPSGQLAGHKCRTTTVAGLRHRAKLCSQNRAAEPEIIENAVAFLGSAFGQYFERTGTGQICGLGLAADMERPVPPNSVAVDTKLVGEGVDTSATGPQQFNACPLRMAADLATIGLLHAEPPRLRGFGRRKRTNPSIGASG